MNNSNINNNNIFNTKRSNKIKDQGAQAIGEGIGKLINANHVEFYLG